ncbi:MAG: hypothetical protein WCY92_05240 [Novosphingobium sp.]
MIALSGNGWLTTLADLSLILFMVTANALAQTEPANPAGSHHSAEAPIMAEPVAIFRPDGDPDALKHWLASQTADSRQRLTIRAIYPAGGETAAVDRAIRLAREARDSGREPRIVLESGNAGDISVSLAYDSDPADMARQLHSADRTNRPEEQP